MKKKVWSLLVALVAVFSISTATFAADGIPRTSGWDEVGYTKISFADSSSRYSGIFESTGGSIQMDMGTNYVGSIHNTVRVELWEDDGAGTANDDKVATLGTIDFTGYVQRFTRSDASNWIDGDNGRAEFYLKYVLSGEDSLYVPGKGVVLEWDYD